MVYYYYLILTHLSTTYQKLNLVLWMDKTLNTIKYKLVINYHALNNSVALSAVATDVGAGIVR